MDAAFEVTLENDVYQLCHLHLNVRNAHTVNVLLCTTLTTGNIFSFKIPWRRWIRREEEEEL
jgi:hypothetical protein